MSSFDAFAMDGEDAYSGYGSYSNFSGGDFSGDLPTSAGFPTDEEVVVEHAVASPGLFEFEDPAHGQRQSPFNPIHLENGNGNGYGIGENGIGDGVFVSDGPILPPPNEMGVDEGYALQEWRRQNAIHLEQKEKMEKEMRIRIIEEAEDYIRGFYEKKKLNVESKKVSNREREKLFAASQEKFHKEADKQYWKAIAELIPNEVPNIEKKRSKKDQDKKPSITVIQGPKPGKPTDRSRMRHILMKLKHTPPPHMIPPPPPPPAAKDGKDKKDGKDAAAKAPESAAGAVPTSLPKNVTSNGSSHTHDQASPAEDPITV